MKSLFAVIIITLSGCADVFYVTGMSTGANGESRLTSAPVFKKYSDTVGPGEIITPQVTYRWRDPSPNVPRQIASAYDPKTGITYTTETPIVGSSKVSPSTIASGNAVNRMMHGISNIVGTVFTGWAGLEAAKGLTNVAVAQSNNAAKVANTSTLSNAGVQNAKTAAGVSKAAIGAGFAP